MGANWQAYEQAGFDPNQAGDWSAFGGAPGGMRWTVRTASGDDLGGFSDFFRVFFGEGPPGDRAGAGVGPDSGSIFGSSFGGAFGDLGESRTGRPPATRAEAHGTVEVTLAEVAKGTERTVAVDGRRLQ